MVGLRIITITVKLDRCTFYIKNPSLTLPGSYQYHLALFILCLWDWCYLLLYISFCKERNACLLGDAPCTSSMVFRDVVSYIVSTVNYIHNMASSITNWRPHIAWGFSNDIFNPIWFVCWIFRSWAHFLLVVLGIWPICLGCFCFGLGYVGLSTVAPCRVLTICCILLFFFVTILTLSQKKREIFFINYLCKLKKLSTIRQENLQN